MSTASWPVDSSWSSPIRSNRPWSSLSIGIVNTTTTLPNYRRADHMVAAIDLSQGRYGRATFEPPTGISTIVLPDPYANSSESPGHVDRVTGPGGAAIFVAHLQPGDRLRLGPGYARVEGH
jgi:hypothetical protein